MLSYQAGNKLHAAPACLDQATEALTILLVFKGLFGRIEFQHNINETKTGIKESDWVKQLRISILVATSIFVVDNFDSYCSCTADTSDRRPLLMFRDVK